MWHTRHCRFFFVLAPLALGFLVALPGSTPAEAQSTALPDAATAVRPPKPVARKAKKAHEKGLRAEQADDWLAAFEAYAQAVTYAPDDTEFLRRREAARFRLVQQHTDRAEREALAGRPEHAGDELRAALRLDPGYSVARERLEQLAPSAPPQQQTPAYTTGAVRVQALPGRRDFDHRGDIRGAYEAVARQFGLTASFDSELPSRMIRFRVAGVDFETAMNLLARQTGTFWRAVDVHTFFVAENSVPKRRQYAPVVVRTVVFPASATPDEMTEIVRLVREIVQVSHTELDTRTRTLTLRDTPESIALAAALIQELEQARGELMLEIELLEVDRNAARRLGITPPSSARLISLNPQDVRALQQARDLAALLAILQRIFGTPGSLAGLTPTQVATLIGTGQLGLSALVPPLVAFGGGKTIFLTTVPGAAADFSDTLTVVRSGRRMLLRAQDGRPATFFVGERFPITLALLSSSLGTSPFVANVGAGAFPRKDFATGGGPVSVVAGDFDGLNGLDLAIADKTDDNITILLNNGSGTLAPAGGSPIAVGQGPVSVVAGDFNRDGKLDLAVANQTANTVSVLLGDGNGAFPMRNDLTNFSGPVSIAVGDFNSDGKVDLAVANQTNNTVTILLGDGNGGFPTRSDVLNFGGPVAVISRDFNADGRLDLAVVNQTANTVSILPGNGDGTFSRVAPDFPTGTGPVAVTAGDFNGDNNLDLAVANQTANSISILLGNGDGTFRAKTDFPTGSAPAWAVAADFTGAGRLDLAVANQTSNSVSIFVGVGDGSFGNRVDLATGNRPTSLAAGDFNRDTRLDLAVANQASNTVSVILNTAVPAVGSANVQTAYPGSEYVDLGLKVRATPRLHLDDEVTLQLQFEIRSLAGVAINGIPVISNRNVEQTIRLRENETTVLTGIVQQDETRTITGFPGFARAAGHLAGRRDAQQSETELLIVITPRQLRLAPRKDRSFYAGPGIFAPDGGRPQTRE